MEVVLSKDLNGCLRVVDTIEVSYRAGNSDKVILLGTLHAQL